MDRSAPMSEHSIHLITEQQSPDILRNDLMQIRENLRDLDQRNVIANTAACSGIAAISGWIAWRIFGRPQDRSTGTIAAGLCAVGVLSILVDNALVTNSGLLKHYKTVPLYYTGQFRSSGKKY